MWHGRTDWTGESLAHEPLVVTLASACAPHTVALLAYRDRNVGITEFRRACAAHGLELTVLPPALVASHTKAVELDDPDRDLFPRVVLIVLRRSALGPPTEPRREEERRPLMAAG